MTSPAEHFHYCGHDGYGSVIYRWSGPMSHRVHRPTTLPIRGWSRIGRRTCFLDTPPLARVQDGLVRMGAAPSNCKTPPVDLSDDSQRNDTAITHWLSHTDGQPHHKFDTPIICLCHWLGRQIGSLGYAISNNQCVANPTTSTSRPCPPRLPRCGCRHHKGD